MRANKQSAMQLKLQLLLTAAILVLLAACNGTGTPGDGITNGNSNDDGTPGSGFVTGGGGLSNDEFCNSPWVQPGPNCGADGTARILPVCAGDQPGIIDACGLTITSAIDLHDPIAMTVNGLTANTRHTIIISDNDAAPTVITPAGGLLATSDNTGSINKITIVQNMLPGAFLGDYTVTVAEEGGGTVQVLTYTLEDLSRVQCVDAGDVPTASFTTADTVYAQVTANTGTLVDNDYDVYVISDIQKPLADGGLISGTPTTVTVAAGTGSVSLGSSFGIGAYDVVVDVNANGIFNQGTDLISRHNRLIPCFAVQAANSGAAQQIASDKNGNKREIFDSSANITAIRDIQAYLTPSEVSGNTTPGAVDTYLVNHQAAWANGNVLTDVAGGAKTSPAQDDSNSEAPWILATFADLVGLGGTTCYDVVIDTNRNGTFDVGTDYVDNVDHLGINTCGVRVSTNACTANVAVSGLDSGGAPLVDGDSTTDTAINLLGTVTGSTGEAYVTITSGEQSNTITIALAGTAYNLNIPLFAGDNHITVSGINADNSNCSKTITIRSVVDLALFRAQLTWDGSTDMDLHMVRNSGGTGYSNGGGGADDCNYSNCNVGLAGTGTNSISWGTGGEEDDPKLDVDCISCGNGIENIWMNQITEDGIYRVYVDAFSGTETGVTVTMSILGTTVGQVICGNMSAGTVTDSCYVGFVTWVGGTSGIGTFTPVGTKAADF